MSKGKVCLAYSGGLDTSVILAWLVEQDYEVICYIADVGQEESDWASVEKKALQIGAKKLIVDDLKREFVEELCWKVVQCNAVYEYLYLLGTSLARPVIARGQMRAAVREGCQFVSHGCTGKGNDQVRFELTFATTNPDIVENRFIGLKSRGCYVSPAMTILRLAHISIEGLVLDGRVISLRNTMSQQWSELIYQGAYFSPERAFLPLDYSQQRVNGQVRLRLYKGSVYVLGRPSDEKLYFEEDASMDSLITFDPLDTTGFITIQAIRVKKYGMQMADAGVKF
ncbi:hypothetical protein CGLO_04161 [Colletotrichum gloeosporioides Cg-14]|uniref:argininosuccinate synthase n=1 Tax=Colletotrichum gloeosporioides (strain Cg-14) TaxID=1237896 RepID=T0KK05_COLGC|nr:hypothetical protein CGLO_04161 [Colletotrichum gloeosporioides Cg-14]